MNPHPKYYKIFAHISKFNKNTSKRGLNAYFFDIIKKAFSKYILSFYSTGI